ncbi:MAG: CPBP family intramembrane glutamic endopeptidase [Acidimicrobiales bacterium]
MPTPAPAPPGQVSPAVSLAQVADALPSRRALSAEVWLVLGLSLGASAVYSILDLAKDLSAPTSLHAQAAVLNGSVTPGQPLLDLAFQLVGIVDALVPVALVAYLLTRSGESFHTIGADLLQPNRDLAWGAGLAAGIGGAGLGLYLLAYHLGLSLQIVATTLPPAWYRIPVLILDSIQDGVLEEVIVAGFLLHRLSQIGWGDNKALLTSAVVRGSYHLYQGFGGFAGNFVMGLIFGRIYQRYGRTAPLVIAHTLIDAVAFVGYVTLKGKVSFIP